MGKMRTSNIEHRTSNIEVKTKDRLAFTSMFNVRCSMFDVRLHFLLLCVFLTGCCHPAPPEHHDYIGKTDPMDIVIQGINDNSNRIPTLWTQLDFTASIIDPQKHTTTAISGDGILMYSRPNSLLVTCDKDVAGQVFQLGSNNDQFWVKIRSSGDAFNYWWGHYANLGKPGCKEIPIRPDLVLEVLGVGMYRSNFLQLPVPVMRFDNSADAYVFDINQPVGDRWETQEEIWYDRQTKLPIKVLLYEVDGRVALKADLSQQTPVVTDGVPRDQSPQIARHYDLFFPDTGTKMSFDFQNDPELQHKGRRNLLLPNVESFHRPEKGDGDTEIQIDKDCATAAMGQ
jgi:hypothetical protein